MKYGRHISKDIYSDHYAPNDARADGQNAYLGA